jgi:hypothetical protein
MYRGCSERDLGPNPGRDLGPTRPPDCENGGVRIFSRIAIAVGIALVAFFVLAVLTEGHAGAGAAVVAFLVIAALVGAGNALYGRHSHGKTAMDRIRPAQEVHNQAADRAAAARRAVAEAERRGERYCPLDPANTTRTDAPTHTDAPT